MHCITDRIWRRYGLFDKYPPVLTGASLLYSPICLGPNTEVHMNNNEIVVLSEESFRPILDILSTGDGVLNIPGNPIRCDCDIAWLVLNQKFLTSISGKCHNGTEFKDLDLFAMKDCGRQSNVSESATQDCGWPDYDGEGSEVDGRDFSMRKKFGNEGGSPFPAEFEGGEGCLPGGATGTGDETQSTLLN
ncbi:unnamed protein product [Darwinula stevensoni]|uniref:Uncharacterized protein n=1 Tax=Darwinula stevensoni TaxID=69355 RepID=A0A7R9FNZ5_9CRUS|nr:unnamed protein product [Darwinula stevensoni]CAG0897368.1 unnamed protein product [Darwinula stevensoni]